jgi:hypothetical protein
MQNSYKNQPENLFNYTDIVHVLFGKKKIHVFNIIYRSSDNIDSKRVLL